MTHDRIAPSRWDAFALDAVSLIASAAFGQLFVAWPFLALEHMAAQPAQLGLIALLYQGAYVLAVLAGRPLLDRIDPRMQAAASNALLALSAAGMVVSTRVGLGMLLVLVTISGLATSWLWPPVMGRVSAGLEGAALNRRLGRFNAAWSTGMVLGPVLGGYLYRWNVTAPFWSAVVYHVISVGLLMTCAPVRRAPACTAAADAESPQTRDAWAQDASRCEMLRFRRMARVALVSGYVALGLLRFQLPGLAKQLDIDSAYFGQIGTFLSLTMAIGFWMLGRHPWWHFRAGWMCGFQAGLACALLLAFLAAGPLELFVGAGLAGVGISFLYASHLYYGVSGGQRRSRLMAIHEILVSGGFLVGAYGGGLIADYADLRTPYVVACGALLAGVGVEFLLYRSGRQRVEHKAHGLPAEQVLPSE